MNQSDRLAARYRNLGLGALIDECDLYFDAADRSNGSLYICTPAAEDSERLAGRLASRLRSAGLWSSEGPKQVKDSQKDAYRTQLALLDIHVGQIEGTTFILCRCNHSSFPSDNNRWNAWVANTVMA